MKLLAMSLALLVALAPATAQTSHRRNPSPGDASANPDMPVPPAALHKIDAAQVQKDAIELAQLAYSIPPDVERASQGTVPKDLRERLRRIEKLSKKLRSQLYLY